MTDEHLAAPCGLYCGSCERLGKECAGCGRVRGKPFWTAYAELKVCPLYDCCINKRKLEHCGLCEELPCKMFKEFYDPALSPQEAEQSVNAREHALKDRKAIGTELWLGLIRKKT